MSPANNAEVELQQFRDGGSSSMSSDHQQMRGMKFDDYEPLLHEAYLTWHLLTSPRYFALINAEPYALPILGIEINFFTCLKINYFTQKSVYLPPFIVSTFLQVI